jgi:hypothetical protein
LEHRKAAIKVIVAFLIVVQVGGIIFPTHERPKMLQFENLSLVS